MINTVATRDTPTRTPQNSGAKLVRPLWGLPGRANPAAQRRTASLVAIEPPTERHVRRRLEARRNCARDERPRTRTNSTKKNPAEAGLKFLQDHKMSAGPGKGVPRVHNSPKAIEFRWASPALFWR